MRIVLRVDIMTHSETMFRELNWLRVYKRVQYHTYILMYKTFNNLAPDYLSERLIGWMDELGFYVPSTVFQSFRDDGRVNMKGSVQ